MGSKKEGERKKHRDHELNGYMTLEMSLVFPMVLALVIMILFTMFFLYDKCRITQDLYTAAYRRSIVRGKETANTDIDTSAYFMLKGCSASVSGGSEIRAEAEGQMTPALITGLENGESLFHLKVSMKARKTDPPYSFRKFRRVIAVAQQVMKQGE